MEHCTEPYNKSSNLPCPPQVHGTQDDTAVFVILTAVFWLFFLALAGQAGHESKSKSKNHIATLQAPALAPTTSAQQLESGDASDNYGDTDINESEPPAYTQDEGGKEQGKGLDLPSSSMKQNTGEFNSGRAHLLESSTLLPMYMDGSDRCQ